MENNVYQKIIDEVSKRLAGEILSKEKDLPQRAKTIDGDIANILKDVGLKTSKQVIEGARDDIINKKTAGRIDNPQKSCYSIQSNFWRLFVD